MAELSTIAEPFSVISGCRLGPTIHDIVNRILPVDISLLCGEICGSHSWFIHQGC